VIHSFITLQFIHGSDPRPKLMMPLLHFNKSSPSLTTSPTHIMTAPAAGDLSRQKRCRTEIYSVCSMCSGEVAKWQGARGGLSVGLLAHVGFGFVEAFWVREASVDFGWKVVPVFAAAADDEDFGDWGFAGWFGLLRAALEDAHWVSGLVREVGLQGLADWGWGFFWCW
jgi:hypothetical protein